MELLSIWSGVRVVEEVPVGLGRDNELVLFRRGTDTADGAVDDVRCEGV